MTKTKTKNKTKRKSHNTVKKVNHTDKELEFIKKLYYENEEIYNDRYKNRKPTNDEWEYERIMIEILLQLYLIYVNYRKIAELRLNNIRQSIKDTVYDYLDNNKTRSFMLKHFTYSREEIKTIKKECFNKEIRHKADC
jgi:hypothetical protein